MPGRTGRMVERQKAASCIVKLCGSAGGQPRPAGRCLRSGVRRHVQEPSRRLEPEETGCSMGNHRIVVVEDDVFIRLDLMTHLRTGGHAIVGTADSAAEALRVVE